MKWLNIQFFICTMLLAVYGCDKTESDCGESKHAESDAYNSFFNNPADIYWGVTGSVRSYTYNYTFGNICTKKNPKVTFVLGLETSNSGSSNPISVSAGTYTCAGVQAQPAILTPDEVQLYYVSDPSEIGMQQCFSGQTSATIYPYMTVSFNTLGSSQSDSLYLIDNVSTMKADIDYNVPK